MSGIQVLSLSRRFNRTVRAQPQKLELEQLDLFVWGLVLNQLDHFADWAALRATCKALSAGGIPPHRVRQQTIKRQWRDTVRESSSGRRVALLGRLSYLDWIKKLAQPERQSLTIQGEEKEVTAAELVEILKKLCAGECTVTVSGKDFVLHLATKDSVELQALWPTLNVIVLGPLDPGCLLPLWLRIQTEHRLNPRILKQNILAIFKEKDGFYYSLTRCWC